MVTGAAGSIGSELCRQIAMFNPQAIVGYEISETGLFYLERELRERFPEVPFFPCIGSVQNEQRLTRGDSPASCRMWCTTRRPTSMCR